MWVLTYFLCGRSNVEKVEKDVKGVFDTTTMLNNFTIIQAKHTAARRNTNSSPQFDKLKIET